MNPNTPSQAWALTLLRGAVGLTFVAHGLQKLFIFGVAGVAASFSQLGIPFPFANAVLVTAVELLGGLALLTGLFTRLAAVPLAITMLVALFTVHLKGGFFLPNGFEYVLVLLAANIALAVGGPGAFAVDNALVQRRRQPELVRNLDAERISA